MSESPEHAGGEDAAAARETTPDVVAIFVENHRDFLSYLERRVGSRAIAEDLLQEAFVRSLGKIAPERDESVMAWFYRTLGNAAVDHHRRHASARRALEAFAAESAQETPPDAQLRDAVCRCVSRLAETLKPEYAAALKRIDVDGISVKQYAEDNGISASNAAVRVFRAREALRKQVARSCGTCADHGCLECTCASHPDGCGTGGEPHSPHHG